MRTAPFVSQDLLAYLEEKFPNKCPSVSTPMDEVRALAGEQRVVAHLKKVFQEQTKKALEGTEGNSVTLTGGR